MKIPLSLIKAATIIMLGMSIGAPAQADPPASTSAGEHRAREPRETRYVYYPVQQVYYAPDKQIWFWMDGGSWNFGVHLPVQYRGRTTSGVPVMLRADQPFVEHSYVEQRYGRPWREKHHNQDRHRGKHGDGDHDDDDDGDDDDD